VRSGRQPRLMVVGSNLLRDVNGVKAMPGSIPVPILSNCRRKIRKEKYRNPYETETKRQTAFSINFKQLSEIFLLCVFFVRWQNTLPRISCFLALFVTTQKNGLLLTISLPLSPMKRSRRLRDNPIIRI